MNHVLIIIGFLLLIIYLSEFNTIKENFSQLILPDFTKSIYTGKDYKTDDIIIIEDDSLKPSRVEDVKQPDYAVFTSGNETISDSPEDIKEIQTDLSVINEELDILSGTSIKLNNGKLNNQAICGEKDKKLRPADFKTPWRRNGENHKTLKLFERYIIQTFGNENETCLWSYSDENESEGCGILDENCIREYKNVGGPDVWENSIGFGESAMAATKNLILNCTGYDPDNPPETDQVINPTYACRRLCCNNLLFPLNNANSDDDKILYKKYLRHMYEKSTIDSVPYVEDSLYGLYKNNSI